MKPDTLGDVIHSMKPDFLGPIAGGRWGCVLTCVEPFTEQFIWAFGYGRNADQARQAAMEQMAEQRFGWMIAEMTS